MRIEPYHGLAGCLTAAIALAACAAFETAPADDDPRDHAASSAALQSTMRELEWLSRTRVPLELDLGVERAHRRQRLNRLALSLEGAADELARSPAPRELTPDGAARFRRLAEELRDESRALAQEAQTGDADELAARLDGLYATCDLCHRAIRDPLPKRD